PLFYLADPAGSTVQFLDAATENVNTTISVGLGPNSIDLSRDRASLFIAVSGEDKIAVVDIAERSVTRNLTLKFTPLSVRDGRSDRLYVTGSDRVVRVLNGTTGQELANSSLFSYQTIAEVSPDGSLLLLTTTDVSALVIAAFDIQNDTPAFLRYSHPDLGGTFRQEAVDWTGGRIYLASGSPYGLEIVSIATLERLGMLRMESYPTGVALAADGSTVYGLSSNGNGAAVWAFDVATGVLQRLERLGRQADLVAVSGDRRGLIVGPPIERIAIEPSLGPWQPAPGIQCFSPSVLLAQLVRGLPDVGVDAATIRLDGSALSRRNRGCGPERDRGVLVVRKPERGNRKRVHDPSRPRRPVDSHPGWTGPIRGPGSAAGWTVQRHRANCMARGRGVDLLELHNRHGFLDPANSARRVRPPRGVPASYPG